MRRALVVLVLAVPFALVGPMASAKNVGTVSITGPGLSEAIELGHQASDQYWGAFDLWGSRESEPFSTDLGPRYDVVLTVPMCHPSDPDVVTQDLYPFARGGPETFTPDGQSVCDAFPSGWSYAPLSLLDLLEAHGLPAPTTSDPSSSSPRAAVVAGLGDPDPSHPAVTTMAVVGVLALVLAVGALAGRGRRRTA